MRAALSAALKDDEQLEVEAEENLPTMGIGGNGWQPGQEGGGLGGGVSAGLNAAMAAAKLAGRAGAGTRNAGKRKEAAKKKSRHDDDMDALLGGGAAAEVERPAEEQFPTSRGLGSRRGKGRLG